MSVFEILAVLTTMAALFSWVNHRYIRLPTTIGLMALTLALSLVLVALGRAGIVPLTPVLDFVRSIDFDQTLLHGMLGALLFAGALHVDVEDMLSQKAVIITLATVGVLISTLLVGGMAWLVFGWMGIPVSLTACLLLGAVLAPTDPIAVGAVLRHVGVPASLFIKITGESLFNDGVGVVVFLLLLEIDHGSGSVSAGSVAHLFATEALGGLVYGAVLGWVTYLLLRQVDNYRVEILLTLAVVTGGYALAQRFHLSGPLAMVVAGLFVGNEGRALAMSEMTRERLDSFWELVDDFLNAVLFVLIGVEVVLLDFLPAALLAGLVMVPVVLIARWLSVGIPVTLLRPIQQFSPHAVKVLTWAGLRGGISVALALSMPTSTHRGLLITVTYVVVCFSILGQGLTVGPMVARLMRAANRPRAAPAEPH
jgi:CPA1 family monovalent cation:H+ antiporter